MAGESTRWSSRSFPFQSLKYLRLKKSLIMVSIPSLPSCETRHSHAAEVMGWRFCSALPQCKKKIPLTSTKAWEVPVHQAALLFPTTWIKLEQWRVSVSLKSSYTKAINSCTNIPERSTKDFEEEQELKTNLWRNTMSHITTNSAWLEEELDRKKGSLWLHSFKMHAHGSEQNLGKWCTFSMNQFPHI